jgi:hypothetical protein
MFAVIWVKDLTDLNGLLWFVPKIYPYEETVAGKALRCSLCLSGWLCFVLCLIYSSFNGRLWAFALIIPAMILSMTLSKIFQRL